MRTACEPAKKTICNLGASGFRDNQPIPQIHRSAGGLRIESFPEILAGSAGHLDQRSRRSRGPPLGSTAPRHRESAAQLRAVPLGAAGLALLIGGTGIAHTLPHSISGAIRFLGIAVVGLLLGNLTGRILGLQRRLDLWGRALSGHLPTPSEKPTRFSGALAMGVLLALNPLLIPAAIQDGLEHRWIGLALKSALDAIALHAWVRSLSPIRWSLSLVVLGVILLWQSAWTVGSASAADWLHSPGISNSVMLASSLLILCSAPAVAGIRRAALANLLPTLVWIPLLNFWLRSH